MEPILAVDKINKRFNQQTVLKDISLEIFPGEIVGLIGKNGSGKTSLFHIILNYIKASSGHYHWKYSFSPSEISNMVSTPVFYNYLSGYDNLMYFCKIRNILPEKIDGALKIVNLEKARDNKFRDYSLGMKQRLGIALSLMNQPKILVLDEPFNGVDPEGIYELSNLIKKLNATEGITVFLSSHVLDDLYKICNRFIFIDSGLVLEDMSKEELDSKLISGVEVHFESITDSLMEKLVKKFGTSNVRVEKGQVFLNLGKDDYSKLKLWLEDEGIEYKKIEEIKKTMNELFIEIIRMDQYDKFI